METNSEKASSEKRNRSIRGAVFTSILSKLGTLILRLVSIPVAIDVLGMKLFGVYATILILVQMADMLHIGIGPALTQKLAKAAHEKNRGKEAKLFSTSLIISAVITTLVCAVLGMVISTVPVTRLFGEQYGEFAEVMRRTSLLALFIIGVEIICHVFEKARDGYMETRYTNLWGFAGNLLGAVLLLAGIWHFRSIEFLVIAVNGSMVLAKVANAIHMMVQRPYLIPSPSTVSLSLIKPLMGGACIFTVVYALSGVTEYNIVAFLVAQNLGPESAANYSILVTLHVSMAGVVQMFTIPMWPAVIDAWERKDFRWVKKGAARLQGYGALFGLAAFGGCALLGAWAVRLWVGSEFTLGTVAMAWFGLYFFLHLWRHVNQTLCLGLSRERSVAAMILLETASVIFLSWTVLRMGLEIPHVLAAICLSLAGASAWMFPLLYRQTFRAHCAKHHPRPNSKDSSSDVEAVISGNSTRDPGTKSNSRQVI